MRPLLALAAVVLAACSRTEPQPGGFAGSRSCKACHARFYDLWATSFHGLAMQPYSRELAVSKLGPQDADITIGDRRYRADISGAEGFMSEDGPDGRRRYEIEQVLGGKNVYYFLTPLERGRLQTLPLAYDARKREWFDMAGSGMRHFPDRGPDAPVDWKDWPYTFNTACYGCHVSQLSTNYDPGTDAYRTVWLEPGINCETCHGPSQAHNRLFEGLPKGAPPPADAAIISVKKLTPRQRNDSCSSCHAKASPLTTTFSPGERFFDHFDLVTLENSDYFPDGRDLGENYTYTTWSMSPCARKSDLDCATCHTSGGRYRFEGAEKANEACLPCHAAHVADPAAHSHHGKESTGSRCVACHMPMTEFARMVRSDHSMRPPAPAATVRFHSPNACNGCHQDKTPEWADQHVRRWHRRDYQAPHLRRGELIAAARARDWTRLSEMLEAVSEKGREEILANSLIRLLRACPDERVGPAILAAMNDSSPLIRSSAAESLGSMPSAESVRALVAATSDEHRLVRIRAAQSLAEYPDVSLEEPHATSVKKATEELLASLLARPDQWTSHYNLGNYYLSRNDLPSAVSAFETAARFDPREPAIRVNLSIAHARQGDNAKARAALREALAIEPDNAEAHFNLGLLEAEAHDLPQAEDHLRRALAADPRMAPAAFNLCVLLAERRPDEALELCREAASLDPREPRFVWTYAYYLRARGRESEAETTLRSLLLQRPGFVNGTLLLAEILTTKGDRAAARTTYDRALRTDALSPEDRRRILAARAAFEVRAATEGNERGETE